MMYPSSDLEQFVLCEPSQIVEARHFQSECFLRPRQKGQTELANISGSGLGFQNLCFKGLSFSDLNLEDRGLTTPRSRCGFRPQALLSSQDPDMSQFVRIATCEDGSIPGARVVEGIQRALRGVEKGTRV